MSAQTNTSKRKRTLKKRIITARAATEDGDRSDVVVVQLRDSGKRWSVCRHVNTSQYFNELIKYIIGRSVVNVVRESTTAVDILTLAPNLIFTMIIELLQCHGLSFEKHLLYETTTPVVMGEPFVLAHQTSTTVGTEHSSGGGTLIARFQRKNVVAALHAITSLTSKHMKVVYEDNSGESGSEAIVAPLIDLLVEDKVAPTAATSANSSDCFGYDVGRRVTPIFTFSKEQENLLVSMYVMADHAVQHVLQLILTGYTDYVNHDAFQWTCKYQSLNLSAVLQTIYSGLPYDDLLCTDILSQITKSDMSTDNEAFKRLLRPTIRRLNRVIDDQGAAAAALSTRFYTA